MAVVLRRLSVIAVGVGAALTALGVRVSQTARETLLFARITGDSVQSLRSWGFAAESVGVEFDQLTDIFRDVQDRVGDFAATGGGALQDFFDTINATEQQTRDLIAEFQNLSGGQILIRVAQELSNAGANAAAYAFVLESLSSETLRLQPLLENNARRLREQQAAFRELNNTTDEQNRKNSEISESWLRLQTALSGLSEELVSVLQPQLIRVLSVLTLFVVELDPLPLPVEQAILLLVGDLYDNREAGGDRGTYNPNPTFKTLLSSYRQNIGV